MDFRFRAGDRGPPVPGGSPPAWFSHPQAGPLPPPLREHIIREAVTRRLNEEWAMGVHGGFRPGPFFAPDRLMPPPHAPMPMPMHPLPHAPPPVPFEGFGAWQGPGPRRHAGFGERTPFPREERRASPPRPDPKRKLKLPEIEPSSGTPEALSPKVPMTKRKADANAATTVPKKVQKLAEDWSCALCQVSAPSEAGLNEHLGGRKHKAKLAQCGVSKAIKDDKNCFQTTTGNENSTDPCDAPKKICMLVDGATCEAGLNEDLGGRKHKAKLALCGASKAIKDDKNSLHTTIGNKNSTDPCDAPKKVFLEVDGEMHEVVRKNNYLWCHCCRVRCDSNVILAGHLRSKMHSKLNKVWTSIKAVRTNTNTREGLPCGSQVNTNVSTEIPGVIEGDINMTTEVDESGPVENPVQKEIHPRSKKHSKLNKVWTSIKAVRTNTNTMEGLPSCGSQVTPRLKELIMFKAQQEAKSDPSSAPKETYANDSSQKRKPSEMTSKVQPPAKKRKDNPPKKTVSSDNHRLKEQRADSRLQEAGEVSRGKAEAFVEMKVEGDSKGGNTSSNQPKPYLHSDKCTAYMSKINLKATELHIRSFFSDIGGVVDIRLQRDRFTKKSRGLAHVDFSDKDHLEAAIRKNKQKLFGKNVIIKDSSKRKKNRKAGTSAKANTKVWTSIKALISKNVSIAPSDPSKSKKNREAGTSAKTNTKVWTSIKAVRTNSNTKEGLPSSSGSQVNTNGSTKIPAVIEGDINMTTAVDESGPVENPVRKEITRMATIKAARTNTNTKKGLPSCGSQVNTDGSTEIPAVIEGDINMTTLVDESGPVENLVRKQTTRMAAIKAVRTNTDTKEGLPSSCGSQVNTNGCTEIPAVIEGYLNMSTGVDESGPVENPVQKEITRMATIWAMFSS